MKTNLLKAVSAMALVGFIFVGTVNAEDAKVPATMDTNTMHSQGMMGKMDMAQMHTMRGDCMKMHKDGKMCDQNTMAKCEENMGKGECEKMMKHTKAQGKSKNK